MLDRVRAVTVSRTPGIWAMFSQTTRARSRRGRLQAHHDVVVAAEDLTDDDLRNALECGQDVASAHAVLAVDEDERRDDIAGVLARTDDGVASDVAVPLQPSMRWRTALRESSTLPASSECERRALRVSSAMIFSSMASTANRLLRQVGGDGRPTALGSRVPWGAAEHGGVRVRKNRDSPPGCRGCLTSQTPCPANAGCPLLSVTRI